MWAFPSNAQLWGAELDIWSSVQACNAPINIMLQGTPLGDMWGYGRVFAHRSYPQGGAFCVINKLKV